ncbi:BC1881 family protein [Sebaldella sp. S0638]|jgi:hypothetical protein|nr:BC1881 family protein [Sebaldella sp. S0638]MCP1226743.1 BC1881 family protein [Sebaldella sp. S0638]
MKIEDIKTCELVEELKRREGVETVVVFPYEKKNIEAEGAMIVLKIID